MAEELNNSEERSEQNRIIAEAEERYNQNRVLAEARLRMEQDEESIVDSSSRIASRFNKGLLDLITVPTNLINAGIGTVEWLGNVAVPGEDGSYASLPRIPGVKQLEQSAYKLGFTPDPEVAASTIPERAAEILGGSAIPVLGLGARGNQVLQASKNLAKTGWLDHLAVLTAKNPYSTAIMEPISSGASAAAGVWAEESGAEDHNVIMAELVGGFTPAALIGLGNIATRVSLLRAAGNNISKNLLPFTKKGASIAASRRLQGLSSDPESSAARIDVEEGLSGARQAAGLQSAEKRLLSLERFILNEDPVMDAKFQETIDVARKAIKARAMEGFPSDTNRPAQLIKTHRDYLVNLVNLAAAKAAKDSASAIRKLDPGSSISEINQTFRTKIEGAYNSAKKTESSLWNTLVSDAPGNLTNARNSLNAEISSRSILDDPNDIPKWLIQALKEKGMNPKTMSVLRKQGFLDNNDEILPAARIALQEQGLIKDGLSFNDLKALRSRILREARKERALDVPNKNKIRILNNTLGNEEKGIKGLMDDLSETGVDGFEAASAFTKQIRARFTQGRVGKLLGFQSSGEKSIADEMTMDHLIGGKDAIVTIKKLEVDHPELLPDAIDYIKKEFLSVVAKKRGIDPAASQTFINKWEKRGLFEVVPDLKSQFQQVRNVAQGERILNTRANRVRSLSTDINKSKAAFYLQESDIGEEMNALLKSKNSVSMAADLVRRIRRIVRSPSISGSVQDRMRSGEDAINGLKASFMEEGISKSLRSKLLDDGTQVLDGDKFTIFMNESKNKGLLKALDFDESEIKKLDSLANLLRKFDAEPGGIQIKGVMEDLPSRFLDGIAAWLGAKTGGRLGADMGSSLVLAGRFSSMARDNLLKLTRNHAKSLLIAAHQNTPEGRQLYRALLTRSTDSPAKQEKASLMLMAYIAGVGSAEGIGVGELADSQDQ
tara:strand:- start:112 stop:2955 length:2844 start_codon:yes stop_codon:yes gene_type:complete